jgi:hypothetical protein
LKENAMAVKKESSGWKGHREDVMAMLTELFVDDEGILQGQMMGHPK